MVIYSQNASKRICRLKNLQVEIDIESIQLKMGTQKVTDYEHTQDYNNADTKVRRGHRRLYYMGCASKTDTSFILTLLPTVASS